MPKAPSYQGCKKRLSTYFHSRPCLKLRAKVTFQFLHLFSSSKNETTTCLCAVVEKRTPHSALPLSISIVIPSNQNNQKRVAHSGSRGGSINHRRRSFVHRCVHPECGASTVAVMRGPREARAGDGCGRPGLNVVERDKRAVKRILLCGVCVKTALMDSPRASFPSAGLLVCPDCSTSLFVRRCNGSASLHST